MNIAIASGKGGAGKTCVTAALAEVWPRPCLAVDADVEAPNLHLFLKPNLTEKEQVCLRVPVLDAQACVSCGRCRDICQYKAIAQFGTKVMIFGDMCHGCGGCFAVCPSHALRDGQRELGELSLGSFAPGKDFLMGKSRIGEAMTPPLLRALHRKSRDWPADGDVLFDAPPGVSCPAMTVVRDVDALLLVVEPTPFGLHDFKLACAAFSRLAKPAAVIVNRTGMTGNERGEDAVAAFCAERGLPVLARIPFSREIAETYARGLVVTRTSPEVRRIFEQLASDARAFVREARHV